jgi:acyl-CoA reductase-like NAD-dependent aldehyde dehydrogenase
MLTLIRAEVIALSTDTAEPTSPAKSDVPHEVVVTCPATGKVVGRVPVATSVEVETVAARLRAAQPGWQQMGVDGPLAVAGQVA